MAWIYSWNEYSEGANNLKDALGIRRIRNEGSTFRGRANKTVINWGSSQVSREINRCRILNPPDRIAVVANKLSFFRLMGASELVPQWTEDFDEACEWTRSGLVCARTILNGHSGNGLVLMDRNNVPSLVRAPLYVKYIKKEEEYRVHIVRGSVIDIQRKVLRRERAESDEEINWQVRNLANGFVYQRNNIDPPTGINAVAISVLQATGLDFGAVDIVWNRHQDRCYCLEVNTAPGIQGTTVQNYANALRAII